MINVILKYIAVSIFTLSLGTQISFAAQFDSQKYSFPSEAWRKRHKINYEEEMVKPYILPDPLTNPITGYTATNAFDWLENVRPALVKSFEDLYSPRPPRPFAMRFEIWEKGEALNGKAERRQVRVFLRGDTDIETHFDILLYIPKSATKPVPSFVNMNFYGNHSVLDDPEIILSDCWSKIKSEEAKEAMRGKKADSNPIEHIVDNGFAYLTFYHSQVFPDTADKTINSQNVSRIFSDGVFPHKRAAISIWSWALSRVMDYIETNPQLDNGKVAVLGHSRQGKTALLTGALDTRFALVISNASGCMGAKISRRNYGENISSIMANFAYWFSDEMKNYIFAEDKMPVDQHQLLSLIAPRPVYVETCQEDYWSDPKGQLEALVAANRVYELFGAKDLPAMSNPKAPFCGATGYHMRAGKHKLALEDWKYFINFAKKHFCIE